MSCQYCCWVGMWVIRSAVQTAHAAACAFGRAQCLIVGLLLMVCSVLGVALAVPLCVRQDKDSGAYDIAMGPIGNAAGGE